MSITGFATPEGTSRYVNRFAEKTASGHFRREQDLMVSSIGIGTYLGQADETTDQKYVEATIETVLRGGNVVDSAANYRFQRSERSIGNAIQRLTTELGVSRDEFVICTKGGYIPFDGAPPRDVRGYIEETFVKPGIAKLEDFVGGSHCMTPRYLESQLTQSLRNMNVDSIDVYYVHNPESQLGYVSSTEIYDRLRAAFELLERMRSQLKIKAYGVATWNGFRVAPDSTSYHSLTRMVEIAKEAGGDRHGFRFIQLPFNLAMPEALTVRNHVVDGSEVSVIEAASELGVTVIASASILQGRIGALHEDIRKALGGLSTDTQAAIQFVRSTPGITTALVGMSSKSHVDENLQLAQVQPVPPEEFVRLFGNE
jgi:aryl-alcohol dehydrogenase-like predicted oxidoreductase